MEQTRCDFCGAALEPSREFIYQFESLKFCDNEDVLNLIRRMPKYQGEPLRICKECNEGIQQNDREREEEAADAQRRQRFVRKVLSIGAVLLAVAAIASVIVTLLNGN